MASLVGNESIEKDGVVAGSHAIQDDVSDGELQECVNDKRGTSSDSFCKRALNGLGRVIRAKRRK